MTNNQPLSPSLLSATHDRLRFDDLYDITHLLKRIRSQQDLRGANWSPVHIIEHQTIISTPVLGSQPLSPAQLYGWKSNENVLILNDLNRRLRGQQSDRVEKQEFNNAAYCVAYCTIIIIGKLPRLTRNPIIRHSTGMTLGGWLGGLFEFITNGLDGCNNEHRGQIECQVRYATLNVSARCVNIFYTSSMLKNSTFLCLCQFRNQSQGKYRDCEHIHTKIRYI